MTRFPFFLHSQIFKEHLPISDRRRWRGCRPRNFRTCEILPCHPCQECSIAQVRSIGLAPIQTSKEVYISCATLWNLMSSAIDGSSSPVEWGSLAVTWRFVSSHLVRV